jgi:hypothetical protein
MPKRIQDCSEMVDDGSLNEIRRLLAIYARAIDRADLELLKTVYWPDAVDDHGVFSGNAHDFADWVIPRLKQKWKSTSHFLGQSLINADGPRANAETYFVAWHICNDESSPALIRAGRYVDELVRRGPEWRIASRLVLIDWSGSSQVSISDGFGTQNRGARHPQDPSYRILRGAAVAVHR